MDGLLWWLIVGLVAGWLAGKVMRGAGYGIIGDIAVGVVGAVIGGWLFRSLGYVAFGIIGNIVVAFIGAVIFVAILRAIKRA